MPERRWDGCAIGGGVAGLILGGTAGAVGYQENSGHHVNSTDRALWAGAGALVGAGLGAVAGHYLCDPVVEHPTPAPPPPPVAEAPPPPPPPPPAKRIVLRGVHFDFNKSKIRSDAEPILDEAADILKQNANVSVEVNGYCDAIGSEAYNMKLSERRAAAVVKYLETKGIPGDRLEPHGYGKTHFVATNKTADGRAENRRVELIPKQ
ncbi:MAG: OmpA family protein [Candidatus Binataceae bacterium]